MRFVFSCSNLTSRNRRWHSTPLHTINRIRYNQENNRPFTEGAQLIPRTFPTIGLGSALSDFRQARRNLGPYSAFYAYRVLEDIGYGFGTVSDHPNWDAMNDAFGTTREHWNLLIETGT